MSFGERSQQGCPALVDNSLGVVLALQVQSAFKQRSWLVRSSSGRRIQRLLDWALGKVNRKRRPDSRTCTSHCTSWTIRWTWGRTVKCLTCTAPSNACLTVAGSPHPATPYYLFWADLVLCEQLQTFKSWSLACLSHLQVHVISLTTRLLLALLLETWHYYLLMLLSSLWAFQLLMS